MQHPFIIGKPFTGAFQPTLLPLLTSPGVLRLINKLLQFQLALPVAATRPRVPRSNTLSTFNFPGCSASTTKDWLQFLRPATQPPAPASHRTVPDEPMSSYDGPAFDQRRNSHVSKQYE